MCSMNSEEFDTIEHYPMWIYQVLPDTYPYVRAPLIMQFNMVYPYSLNDQKCKLDEKIKCSLRKAYIRYITLNSI